MSHLPATKGVCGSCQCKSPVKQLGQILLPEVRLRKQAFFGLRARSLVARLPARRAARTAADAASAAVAPCQGAAGVPREGKGKGK